MAYQTGTASDVNDILDKFRLFAIAQGWSVNRWATVGSGRELCIKKGSAYFNFRAWNNEWALVNGDDQADKTGLAINGSDGYLGGNAWDRQPGYPQRRNSAPLDQAHAWFPLVINIGPFPAYHFFAPDSKTLYAEVEVSAGIFMRFGCGSLDLFNPAAPGGGRFFYATGGQHVTDPTSTSIPWLEVDVDDSSLSLEEVPFRCADYCYDASFLSGSYLRVQHDSFDNWAHSAKVPSTYNTGSFCQGGGVHDRPIRDLSPNSLNGVGVLLPNIVSVNRNQEYLSPVGTVPGMRYMDMTNYLPGDEFTLGSDTWKVFPWYAKGGRSGQRGIAYLKVA